MKSTDRVLAGIVAGMALLVVSGLAVALLKSKPAYQSDTSPEGAANNYLLALQQGDYERAYGYLSPKIKGYPDSAGELAEAVSDNRYQFDVTNSASLNVQATHVNGPIARVVVYRQVFHQNGLFDSYQTEDTFDMHLVRIEERWLIEDSERYWARCWNQAGGCR
jgi:hypothetical protein